MKISKYICFDKKLENILKKSYFTKDNAESYTTRNQIYRTQLAINTLWNTEKIIYKDIVFNNKKIREVMINEMVPGNVDLAVSLTSCICGSGDNYRIALSIFMFAFFGDYISKSTLNEEISIYDWPDLLQDFIRSATLSSGGKIISSKSENRESVGKLKLELPKKKSIEKKYFILPNLLFQMELSAGAIVVYSYLIYCEDRKTYTCYPSYSTIGEYVGMSPKTVKKYVRELENDGLIKTEPTTIRTQKGKIHNGTLKYTILPIDNAKGIFELKQWSRIMAEQRQAISENKRF